MVIRCRTLRRALLCVGVLLLGVTFGSAPAEEEAAPAGDDSAALAEKLQNPVAALISVPFFEWGIGQRSRGFKYTLNFQPVIPISISEDWNVISRTIVPIIHQDDVVPDSQQGGHLFRPGATARLDRRGAGGRDEARAAEQRDAADFEAIEGSPFASATGRSP